jgi:uracil-DNA glycosylase
MTPHSSERRSTRRARPGAGRTGGGAPAADIQEAYLSRAIAEIGALNDDIAGCERCAPDDEIPVMSSGSPQAQIMLIKWAPSLAERQEGVAFFGRAGTAILKSVQRLGIDPLDLYGTLCVKCTHQDPERAATLCPAWLVRELHIVMPRMIVPMGPRALEAVNGLDFPLAEPLRAVHGEIQRFTPGIEALYVPDIDASLDEQGAKRAFWEAFRALGDWHEAQPPY